MNIDYVSADRTLELSFGKFNKASARIDFPQRGILSKQLGEIFTDDDDENSRALSHRYSPMLASAGVEMWHRAIHSFLLSVALSESSPMWASVTGYYSSHFVMRAFAHSMGIFKSFTKRVLMQVCVQNGNFLCIPLKVGSRVRGEHAFYWKAVKEYPRHLSSDLFRENSERDLKSDSAHRTFANYTDHVNSFQPLSFLDFERIANAVDRISRIRLHSVTTPSRDDYPDLQNVQILAFHRIIAFHDFLDEKVGGNRFWRAHRRPAWCRDMMIFQVEDQGLEQVVAA